MCCRYVPWLATIGCRCFIVTLVGFQPTINVAFQLYAFLNKILKIFWLSNRTRFYRRLDCSFLSECGPTWYKCVGKSISTRRVILQKKKKKIILYYTLLDNKDGRLRFKKNELINEKNICWKMKKWKILRNF